MALIGVTKLARSMIEAERLTAILRHHFAVSIAVAKQGTCGFNVAVAALRYLYSLRPAILAS
jgi:hypothetical protein